MQSHSIQFYCRWTFWKHNGPLAGCQSCGTKMPLWDPNKPLGQEKQKFTILNYVSSLHVSSLSMTLLSLLISFKVPTEQHVNVHGKYIKINELITGLIWQCNVILNCQVDSNSYGIDWDGPLPSQEWDGQHEDDCRTVEVPSTSFPLSQAVLDYLQRTIDPLRNTQYHGVDIYLEVVCILGQGQNNWIQ